MLELCTFTIISHETYQFLYLAPSAPRNFSLLPVEASPRQLEASWIIPDLANGEIQNYTLTCNESITFNVEYDNNVETTTVSFTLNGLEPYTAYECSVFATTNGGQGMASSSVTATTTEDGKACA